MKVIQNEKPAENRFGRNKSFTTNENSTEGEEEMEQV